MIVEYLRPDFTTWVSTAAGITGRNTIEWSELAGISEHDAGFMHGSEIFLPIEEVYS
jgi:hypothetical protein